MSASLFLNLLIFGIVAVIVYRQYKRDRKYFGDLTARPQHTKTVEPPPLDEAELARRYAALKAELAKHPFPSVRIQARPGKPSTPWQSKFGGKPYWPKAMDYPRTPDGTPMYMIAQLNLAEMPALPGYPASGILQFFIADDEYMGLKLGQGLEETIRRNSDGSGSRVVFHREIVEDTAQLECNLPQVSEAEVMPLSAEYALSFTREDQLPLHTDHRFQQAVEPLGEIHDDLMEKLWDESEATTQTRLGGYAYFTQDDPRYAMEPGEWLLLFQMDTDDTEGVDIMWGDSGVGNWFIHRDDLAKQDFSRMWFNWDCC